MSEVNVRNPALALASEASSEVTQKFATCTLLLHLLLTIGYMKILREVQAAILTVF